MGFKGMEKHGLVGQVQFSGGKVNHLSQLHIQGVAKPRLNSILIYPNNKRQITTTTTKTLKLVADGSPYVVLIFFFIFFSYSFTLPSKIYINGVITFPLHLNFYILYIYYTTTRIDIIKTLGVLLILTHIWGYFIVLPHLLHNHQYFYP